MSGFAVGRRALGICDRCGLTYKLHELKTEYVQMRPTNMLLCDACRDEDHPQSMQGMRPVYDPQSLRNARPDTGVDASRTLTGTLTYPPVNGVEDL